MTRTAWVFGDSFQTSNYPPECKQSWVDILFNRRGYTVKNFARAGVSTEDIVLTCIDSLPDIQPNDYVLVCLSAERRFMAPEGSGNIMDPTEFTKYINTKRIHKDIWQEWKQDKDTRIFDIADRFNTPLGDKLKISVFNNYICMLLDDKKVNYRIIHGHSEPIDVKSSHVINYMEDYEFRCWKPEVTAYYNLKNTLDFAAGKCLINDFFHCQIEHILNTFGQDQLSTIEQFSKKFRKSNQTRKLRYAENAKENFIDLIAKHYGHKHSMFYDAWHLNESGHEIYARFAENYNWGFDE